MERVFAKQGQKMRTSSVGSATLLKIMAIFSGTAPSLLFVELCNSPEFLPLMKRDRTVSLLALACLASCVNITINWVARSQ